MADFYAEMAGIATELLTEFKQGSMALLQYTPASGPPHNPGKPSWLRLPFNGTANGVSAYMLQDTLVQSSDRVVNMPAAIVPSSVKPTVKDRIEIDGVGYQIIKATPKPAAGDPVVWQVVVRS